MNDASRKTRGGLLAELRLAAGGPGAGKEDRLECEKGGRGYPLVMTNIAIENGHL